MIPKSDMYKDTVVSAIVSKEDVHKLLAKFNITERRWTELSPDNTFLEFIIRREGKPPLKIKINVPFVEKKQRGEKVHDEARAFRFFYHYIKALLSAKDAEITSIEEVFMAHITIPLPNGQEITLGDQLTMMLESGNAPRLEGFNVVASEPALPERKEIQLNEI